MDPVLIFFILVAVAIIAAGGFQGSGRPEIMYVPIEVPQRRSSCLPVLLGIIITTVIVLLASRA